MIQLFDKNNFKKLSLKLFSDDQEVSFEDLLKKENRVFNFHLELDNLSYRGEGIRGDDAIWVPFGDVGLKIFSTNEKYGSLDDCLVTINKIKEIESFIFPEIYWVEMFDLDNKKYIITKLENVKQKKSPKIGSLSWPLPSEDRLFAENFLQAELYYSTVCVDEFYNHHLKPEDEWYKPINMINGTIVDFHRFEFFPERYKFKSNGRTKEELDQAYRKIVDRYKSVLDHNGQPKWKGKIYQGFEFDNGYNMVGYSSDDQSFDSYKKLPFIPYGKVKNKKVLDIGSNQGFFSFQAAIHGASEVVGLELQKEDVQAANDIKEILDLPNVKFINQDAIKYIMETNDKYGLVIANSVLHQIYKNLDGADEVLTKIASMTDYFAFETPVRHPTTTIGLAEIHYKLKRYFKIVRLLYFYDAYSSGYRANFICYS